MKDNKYVLYANKKKVLSLTIVCFIMLFFSVLFTYVLVSGLISGTLTKLDWIRVLWLLLAPLASIFFGAGFVFLVKKLLNNNPIFIIDEDGMTDKSSAFTFGRVKWSDIKSIKTHLAVAGDRWLSIELNKDPKSLIAKANRKLGYSSYNISENNLGCDLNVVIAKIKEFAPELIK